MVVTAISITTTGFISLSVAVTVSPISVSVASLASLGAMAAVVEAMLIAWKERGVHDMDHSVTSNNVGGKAYAIDSLLENSVGCVELGHGEDIRWKSNSGKISITNVSNPDLFEISGTIFALGLLPLIKDAAG